MAATVKISSLGYNFYIGDYMLPITPSSISWRSKNQNKTLTLMDYGEINLIKPRGLSEFSFDFDIPVHNNYPFSRKPWGLPDVKINYLRDICNSQKPVWFRIIRFRPGLVGVNYGIMFDTSMRVTIEDWSFTESASNAGDIRNHITLKQYKTYATASVEQPPAAPTEEPAAAATPDRAQDDAPKPSTTYTVKKGDCLYNISKKLLGNGNRWREIWNLNKDKVPDPNKLKVGTVLTIPS
jgi:LysM repeat protein